MPCTKSALKPKVVNNKKYYTGIKNNQAKQQKYYNRKGVKNLLTIAPGSNVFVQTKSQSEWLPGIVLDKVKDRRYRVRLNNGPVLVRNRIYIKLDKSNKNHYSLNSDQKTERKEKEKDVKIYLELDSDNNESVSDSESEVEERRQSLSEIGETESNTYVSSEDYQTVNDHIVLPATTSSGRVVKPPKRLDL